MSSTVMNDTPKVFGPETKYLHFRFFPQGASTTPLVKSVGGGNGFLVNDRGVTSVTRTGTAGTFTVQLTDRYFKLNGAQATVQHTTAVDLVAQCGDYNADAGTLVVRLNAAATPTDMAANANSSVSVFLAFQDSAESDR